MTLRMRSTGLVVAGLLLAGCTAADPAPATTTARPSTTTAVAAATTTTAAAIPTATTVAASTTTTAAPEGNPAGWDTWTLIYASLDTRSHDSGEAEAIAATIEGSGVLLSDEYPSLNPGYWAVYGGSWGSRSEAGSWCPDDLDPGLSCYPRYLGPRVEALLEMRGAVAQIGPRLAIIDPETGATLRSISEDFHNEAEFPGHFALNRSNGTLFFGLGFEDSWYSCESEKGEIRRLDLEDGSESLVGDGWWPAVSPDGRWLAVVTAGGCYPDSANSDWFVAPGNQVEIYDLQDDSTTPAHVLRVSTPATDYGEPTEVGGAFWDGDSGELLVVVGNDQVHRISFDSAESLDAAPVEYETPDAQLIAVTPEAYYLVAHDDQTTTLIVRDRGSDEILSSMQVETWMPGVTIGADAAVLVGAGSTLILPDGRVVVVGGIVENLAW